MRTAATGGAVPRTKADFQREAVAFDQRLRRTLQRQADGSLTGVTLMWEAVRPDEVG